MVCVSQRATEDPRADLEVAVRNRDQPIPEGRGAVEQAIAELEAVVEEIERRYQ